MFFWCVVKSGEKLYEVRFDVLKDYGNCTCEHEIWRGKNCVRECKHIAGVRSVICRGRPACRIVFWDA